MGNVIRVDFKKRRYFAAVGPGVLYVRAQTVYGLGHSRYEALQDAKLWSRDVPDLRAIEIDLETYDRVLDGEVSTEALGIGAK